jgi:DNA-binding transcriptional MocR family regulator
LGACAILSSSWSAQYGPVRPRQCHTNQICLIYTPALARSRRVWPIASPPTSRACVLGPGAKLPTTRELAAAASINHLTAARVYRRLAEQGYVAAQVGRGTFVRAHPPVHGDAEDEDWQLAALRPHQGSYAEQMLAESLGAGRDAIPLAAGFPADELLPTAEMAGLAATILGEAGAGLEYLPVEGLLSLREQLAEHGGRAGWAQNADEIVVTTGARQAIDLVVRTVLGPGDAVAIESPTFTGSLTSLYGAGAQVLPLPVDQDGVDVGALERLLARHEIRMVMLQPACQNPTGADLSAARRERLAALRASAASSSWRTGSTRRWPSTGATARGCGRWHRPTLSTSTRCRRPPAAGCGWAGSPPAARSATASCD